jgi:hypothetical protein
MRSRVPAERLKREWERTDQEARLYGFDYMPNLGPIRGFTLRLIIETLPPWDMAARREILRHSNGLVFVVDSSHQWLDASLSAYEKLARDLVESRVDPSELGLALQYNKRDLQEAAPIETVRQAFKRWDASEHETIATQGTNLWEPLRSVVKTYLTKTFK